MITYLNKPIEYCELSKVGLWGHNFIMDIDKLIGKNLRRLRESRHISQEGLAEIIKTPSTRLSAYETGREGMGKDIMMRICKAFNIEPYEFYINALTPIPSTPLQLKLLNIAKEAESLHVEEIADEMAEYTTHRLQSIKKQEKEKPSEGKATRSMGG